jgi:hypothetical protein
MLNSFSRTKGGGLCPAGENKVQYWACFGESPPVPYSDEHCQRAQGKENLYKIYTIFVSFTLVALCLLIAQLPTMGLDGSVLWIFRNLIVSQVSQERTEHTSRTTACGGPWPSTGLFRHM